MKKFPFPSRIISYVLVRKMWISAAIIGLGTTLHGAPVTQVVVVSGDPAPDRDGVFDYAPLQVFTYPVINNRGWVAFRSALTNTSRDYGVFLGNSAVVVQVARKGDAVLDGHFLNFNAPALNEADQTLFTSSLISNSSTYNILRSEPQTGGFSRMLAPGQAAPVSPGTLYTSPTSLPAFNQNGQIAFEDGITGATGLSDDTGIFRSNGAAGSFVQIVREGQIAPDVNGKFDDLSRFAPAMNESGQIAFEADLTATAQGSTDNHGLYVSNGTTLTQIARSNSGNLLAFGANTGPDINDAGDVVFYASVSGTSGIFRSVGGVINEVVRGGQTIPGSTDTFAALGGYPRINNAGQVTFVSSITPTSDDAIFRSNGNGTGRIMIARERDAAPTGTYFRLNSQTFSMNAAGQIAFTADVKLTPTSSEVGTIFFFSGSAVFEVARVGTSFLGSTINDLQFAGTSINTGVVPRTRSGLNDAGQVAFRFTLANNKMGIAIWSPDAPTQSGTLRVESITKTAQGWLLRFIGASGGRYLIENDDDLVRPWSILTTGLTGGPDGRFQYEDKPSPVPSRRFYRAVESP